MLALNAMKKAEEPAKVAKLSVSAGALLQFTSFLDLVLPQLAVFILH